MKRYVRFFEQEQLEKSFLCDYEEYKVYTVNGDYVKVNHSIEFVEGGNFKVYDFIPENEIWIDNKVDEKDFKFIILHEYVEVKQMLKGLDYDSAHKIANEVELEHRVNE